MPRANSLEMPSVAKINVSPAAASSPCPSPSMTATKAPFGNPATRCRSPHSVSPGKACETIPHSIPGKRRTVASPMATRPFAHHYGCSRPDLGADFELIHQTAHSREPHAQPFAGRIPVLHGKRKVGDSRSLVLCLNREAPCFVLVDNPEKNLAFLGVFQDIARRLGNCGSNESKVRPSEACLLRQSAPLLACSHDISFRRDHHLYLYFNLDSHYRHLFCLGVPRTQVPLPDPLRS